MTYTEPLLLLFSLLSVIGLVRLWRRNRRASLLVGVAGLILCGWPPVEWLLSRPLEAQYPVRPFKPVPGLQAIVVFGSSISPPLYERPYPRADFETVQRCAYAAWVYQQISQQTGPIPVVACGGRASGKRPACAVIMRQLLRQAGVPDLMIQTEEQSRSTYENARFGAEVLHRLRIDRVALVVDARSMPRAAAALGKQGIQVTPVPSRFREWDGPIELLPSWQAIRGNEETLHEALGLFWYKWRGWV